MKNHFLIFFIAWVTSSKKPAKPFTTNKIAPWEPYVLPVYLLAGLTSTDKYGVNTWEIAEMLTVNENHYEKISNELYRLGEHTDKENHDSFLATLTTGLHESIETQDLGEFDSEHGGIMQDFNYYEMTKALWLGRAVTSPYQTLDEYLVIIFEKSNLRENRQVFKKCVTTLAKLTKYKPQKIAAMLVTGGYVLKP